MRSRSVNERDSNFGCWSGYGRHQGDSGPDASAGTGCRIDGKFATNQMDSLTHAYQSKACCSLGLMNVESDAVISNDESEIPGGTSDIYFSIAGVAVFCDVVERLLNNPEKCKCDVIVQVCRNVRT